MRRNHLVLAGGLAALLLFAGAFAAAPIGGDEAAPPSEPTTVQTPSDEQSTPTATATPAATETTAETPTERVDALNRTYDGIVITALADAGDGSTLIAGTTGLAGGNATVVRAGDARWRYEDASPNRTHVAALEPARDGGAYVLAAERRDARNGSRPEVDVRLLRLGSDGALRWEAPLNTSARATADAAALAVTDDAPTVAYRTPDERVRLTAFDDAGEVTTERTYGVAGSPADLVATDDGYLLTGMVGYGDPWVLRTDASGDPTLNVTRQAGRVQRVAGAVPTDDGGAIVAGWRRAGIGGYDATPWAARYGSDGVPVWNRVYPTGGDARVQEVVTDGDGLAMLGVEGSSWSNARAVRVVGVGPDGAERSQSGADVDGYLSALTVGGDGTATVATASLDANRNVTSAVRTVELAERAAGSPLEADVGVTSNETVYSGQDLLFERPDAAGETYDLVAIPGEYDEFDRHVERRIVLDDEGRAVVESATLSDGEYVVQTPDGQKLAASNGTLRPAGDDEPASFRVQKQRLRVRDLDDTFVEAGSERTALPLSTDRTNFSVYVTADRFRGDVASAAELRAAFADTPGFAGVEAVNGQPAAVIEVGPDNAPGDEGRFGRTDYELAAELTALDSGLYDVRVASVDAADGGAAGTTQVVVGAADARALDVRLEDESLTVAVGNESATNVTVSGATRGIGAMSMSAERTGDVAVDVRLRLGINATRSGASAGWSDDQATAGAEAFDADTPNATVRVGTLSVQASPRSIDANASANNTVSFELDWVVDERGVPYAIPDGQTITVEVTDLERAADDGHGSSASASGSESGSGSDAAAAAGDE